MQNPIIGANCLVKYTTKKAARSRFDRTRNPKHTLNDSMGLWHQMIFGMEIRDLC